MKRIILTVVLLVVLLFFLFIVFVPVQISNSQQTTVNLPINDVSPEIINLRNWVKWFPELIKIDSEKINYSHTDSILISAPLTLYKKKSNPAFIELTEKNDKGITDYTIQLVPDSFGFGTKIIWSTRTSLLSWLENKFNHRHNNSISGQNLNAFRMFAESPKRFFGFDIQIRPVEDTLVMTNYSTCQKASVTHTLKSLYFKIENLAIKYNIYIDSNRNRLAAFEFKGRDSVIVMAGIPVKKKFLPVNGVSYLEMPPKGRMLVGYYEGPYQGIHQLYTSMNKFARIRSLSKIATPFEKYLTSPLTASDSLHMKIELCYPIL